MRLFMKAIVLAFLLYAASTLGFAQLRNLSQYLQNRINTDKTYFMLHDTGAAEYKWASEWTDLTVNAYADKTAMFVWHFKDGTKAYSRQGDHIGDSGMITPYLLADQSSNLADIHVKNIQPMTRSNYPVKVELWIGEIEDTSGFSPQTLVDSACFDEKTLEYNKAYQFTDCQ